MAVARWVYRAGQFRRALSEQRSPVTRDLVDTLLDPSGQALFARMSRRDQVHSVNTARRLAGRADAGPELLVAALLHDVAKGGQSVWQRVFYVLLSAVSPALVARLARPGDGTRGALHRSLHHPALGAALAAGSGYSDRVCRLIAGHHQPAVDSESDALRWADELA